MKTFKLFNTSSLNLEALQGSLKRFALPQPTTIDKIQILEGLILKIQLPARIADYIPEDVLLTSLVLDESTTPSTVHFTLGLQLGKVSQRLEEFLRIQTAELNIQATEPMVTE